jgi:hypothetical protein
MRHNLAYIGVITMGFILAYSADIFKPEKASAGPPTVMIPTIQSPTNFKINFDLEKGIGEISSDKTVSNAEVTINNPTKIVEKVVEKPVYKERIVYETKTQVLTRFFGMTLLPKQSHSLKPVYPTKVE